ncbi:protein PET117 homolog, mitochondrial [Trichogramma pretiosum]|uniref:protein PET117 homolog, mitochondrial n=1 Tax=Trichogramma pretiosum TaxID=7493 RepID=UPI0006C955FC|nr:protein PET117 homolog, mitochondrial [Trichogramma pretiosum]
MSMTSKTFLALCTGISGGIIIYVHYKQESDRENLHLGVIKDLERQRRRKIENIYILEQQSELTKQLRKEGRNPDEGKI